MKVKITLAATLLLASNSWADQAAYYDIEEIGVIADGALYGPFPTAMSEDGLLIATYSMKASLKANIDIGLPMTFNRECQYDDVVCELEFYGSESAGDLSYENGYKAWRNAQSDAANGYISYFMGSTLLEGVAEQQIPYLLSVNDTDSQVMDLLRVDNGDFVVGYSSAPYDTDGNREFVRRAFIKSLDGGEVMQLISPELIDAEDDDHGRFSSAYKIKEINGKVLVIGAASVSYPRNTDEYFQDCYFSAEDSDRYNLNELVNCPGFDTQAWVWDVTDFVQNGEVTATLEGSALATEWLEGNEENYGNLTFTAATFDINEAGIAVGTSTFEYYNNTEGARQRAIIMKPDSEGNYGEPIEITKVYQGISDQDEALYNTWAKAISSPVSSDSPTLIIGNREYAYSKGRNIPTEFFVYDMDSDSITFPLLDKKVQNTAQRLAGSSAAKTGANSYIYAMNENGLMVGKADDYDQTDPVYQGTPRSQTAFLYDNNLDNSWILSDLLCTAGTDGVITVPRIRLRSARVIGEDGTILAEGFKYDNDNDYKLKVNAKQIAFKLTRNLAVTSPENSPNCWESELLKQDDEKYERQGGGGLWFLILTFPLLLLRRFIHN